MWSNMTPVYGFPSLTDELGTSNHRMVLLVPAWFPTLGIRMVQKIVTGRMAKTERALHVYFDPGTDQVGVFVHIAYVRGTVYNYSSKKLWIIY